VNRRRLLRLAQHPLAALARRLERAALEHRLPVGQVATTRRLLRKALGDRTHALVIGHPGPVRQAWPAATLDVVGTARHRGEVTVVSEAVGEGSLPRRWSCVVVTEATASRERLLAAAGACLPGGALAVMTSTRQELAFPPDIRRESVLRSRRLRLVVTRVPA
jgi:hypothetical protein